MPHNGLAVRPRCEYRATMLLREPFVPRTLSAFFRPPSEGTCLEESRGTLALTLRNEADSARPPTSTRLRSNSLPFIAAQITQHAHAFLERDNFTSDVNHGASVKASMPWTRFDSILRSRSTFLQFGLFSGMSGVKYDGT